MDRLQRLFSLSGRSSRLDYWRVQRDLTLAAAIVLCLTVLATQLGGWLGGAPFLLLGPIQVAGVCVAVRRLHDRNRRGGWLLVFWLAPYALIATASALSSGHGGWGLLASPLMSLAGLFLYAWGWIELGFRRGARGFNAFGAPSPT
jgi:uncharacterized membrane protein YhaH (DUF805 family)